MQSIRSHQVKLAIHCEPRHDGNKRQTAATELVSLLINYCMQGCTYVLKLTSYAILDFPIEKVSDHNSRLLI